MNFTISPALRAKLYNEDRVLLGWEYRHQWLIETKQRKEANADLVVCMCSITNMPYDAYTSEQTKRANRTMAIVLTVLVILPFCAFLVLIIDEVIN